MPKLPRVARLFHVHTNTWEATLITYHYDHWVWPVLERDPGGAAVHFGPWLFSLTWGRR